MSRVTAHAAAGGALRRIAPAAAAGARTGGGVQHSIPSLDGIRACAVMLVFAGHSLLQGRVPGDFGVTVFFFLSGYLITTLLRIEHEKTGAISFRAFYLRRVLRIFPPFYLVLAAATLLTVVGVLPGQRIRPDAVLMQALFLTNYHVIFTGWWTGHAPGTWIFWSLAVEEHFYLAFPLAYLLLLRLTSSRRRQALILAGACALVLAWRVVLVLALGAEHAKDRTYVATDTRIDSILFGCILAVLANPQLDARSVSDRSLKWIWFPLATAGLLVSFAVRSPRFQETAAYTLQGICLFPLFIAAVRLHDWGPFRLLNLRWVEFVGVLSYSIYLVHPAVLWAVGSRLHGVAQTAVGLAVTLAIAGAIYVAVEQPSARLRRRLARVLVPSRPATAASAPDAPLVPEPQAVRP